jgi:hypothetical protein
MDSPSTPQQSDMDGTTLPALPLNVGNEGVNIASREVARKRSRAAVACTRCRRLRKKCLHQQAQVPCVGCQEAGAVQDCRFPNRGEPDYDRSYRRAKKTTTITTTQVTQSQKATPSPRQGTWISSGSSSCQISPPIQDRWDLLPPHSEVVEACKTFWTSFFQLGFLPKAIFLEQLANRRTSINVFFLLGILSVSARFTPSLISRYGDGLRAADIFMERAATLVVEEMYTPTLERTQAFFLLAIAEWGKGDKTSSNIHMGIAVRMAGMLRLHREETYKLSENSTAEDVINAEMARRTFWMLESQDNLHSGYTTPVSFSLLDVTTLLPCDERDFSFGLIPSERAALAGTLAAARTPSNVHSSSRSLFAALIQAHNLWGQIARGAVTSSDNCVGDTLEAWKPESDYNRLRISLSTFEEHMPTRHKWSIWNFRGYKAEGLDLAYLSVVMVIRLSNIILRRSFIENIISSKDHDDAAPENFWVTMSSELFENVLALHEQIDAFFSLRAQDQGFPAMIVFCVYVCGSLANHLWKRPEICPHLATGMQEIVQKSLKILSHLQHPWQLARKWKQALEQRAANTGLDRPGQTVNISEPGHTRMEDHVHLEQTGINNRVSQQLRPQDVQSYTTNQFDGHDLVDQSHHFNWAQQPSLSVDTFDAFNMPEDDIETQLLEFLQVQGQLGMLYD